MAERRMFAKSIVLSGKFRKLPPMTQLLYYQLCMQADDDGFHDAPEFTMRSCRATQQDLTRLEEQGFLHCFESGAAVILHWRIHNQIRKDRRKPTLYTQELGQLFVSDSGEYRLTGGQPVVANLAAQDRLGKDRSGEDRIGQDMTPASQAGSRSAGCDPPRLAQILCHCLEHQIQADAMEFYSYYEANGWQEDGHPVWDWKKQLKKWEADHAGTSTDPLDRTDGISLLDAGRGCP